MSLDSRGEIRVSEFLLPRYSRGARRYLRQAAA
jgi:hypothetical protein